MEKEKNIFFFIQIHLMFKDTTRILSIENDFEPRIFFQLNGLIGMIVHIKLLSLKSN